MDRHNESHGHSLNCRYKRNIIDKTRLKISNTPSELIPMVTKLDTLITGEQWAKGGCYKKRFFGQNIHLQMNNLEVYILGLIHQGKVPGFRQH